MLKAPFHNSTAPLHKLFVRCLQTGIVPPSKKKKKGHNLVTLIHPYVIPNLYGTYNTKEDILKVWTERKKNREFFLNILFLC